LAPCLREGEIAIIIGMRGEIDHLFFLLTFIVDFGIAEHASQLLNAVINVEKARVRCHAL
jgi:hypothetical protein